jgi:hypothetical protein
LQNFNVGTERAKRNNRGDAPDPKDLCPIWEYRFDNPARQVKKLQEIKNKNATTNSLEGGERIQNADKTQEEEANPVLDIPPPPLPSRGRLLCRSLLVYGYYSGIQWGIFRTGEGVCWLPTSRNENSEATHINNDTSVGSQRIPKASV